MSFEYSVDLISDLNLSKTEQFDWTGKPTSLFCIIAGNLSPDKRKIRESLEHLSTMYRGVFYIDGPNEHHTAFEYEQNVEYITEICKPINNVIYMHNHVVVLNGIAIIAINGWYGNLAKQTQEENYKISTIQNEDMAYLSTSIRNLQLHKDAQKIVVVSNSIPADYLLFNQSNDFLGIEPALALVMDTDKKVTHWLYGGTAIMSDMVHNGRRYVNNPKTGNGPYWPKRILV